MGRPLLTSPRALFRGGIVVGAGRTVVVGGGGGRVVVAGGGTGTVVGGGGPGVCPPPTVVGIPPGMGDVPGGGPAPGAVVPGWPVVGGGTTEVEGGNVIDVGGSRLLAVGGGRVVRGNPPAGVVRVSAMVVTSIIVDRPIAAAEVATSRPPTPGNQRRAT